MPKFRTPALCGVNMRTAHCRSPWISGQLKSHHTNHDLIGKCGSRPWAPQSSTPGHCTWFGSSCTMIRVPWFCSETIRFLRNPLATFALYCTATTLRVLAILNTSGGHGNRWGCGCRLCRLTTCAFVLFWGKPAGSETNKPNFNRRERSPAEPVAEPQHQDTQRRDTNFTNEHELTKYFDHRERREHKEETKMGIYPRRFRPTADDKAGEF